ncbi:hypothetical protein F5Y12DRAFT_789081 [Xylaria sp. FL1777]|nr:hypothetical protein F5Y12DRAFT_789081 [Xylaria sp. FL1777]
MGRTEPTVVKPPSAFRRDARAKRARATINKVIPMLLSAHPRARRGIERSELIVDPPRCDPHCVNGPRITLCVADTLTAAHSLLDSGSLPAQQQRHQQKHQRQCSREEPTDVKHKVGILNMASPLSPGGGFLNGAASQEESLCMRTTLLPALRDEYYRIPELAVVYAPDVLVFRPGSSPSFPSPASSPSSSSHGTAEAGGGRGGGEDDKDVLPKNDRWFVDVVSAAMLRHPETESGRYVNAADRELVVRKMNAVLRVFATKGCRRVVLGAWGCGAYGNPVSEIAKAWRQVLSPKISRNTDAETWGAFIEDVVFAIQDGSVAAAFARAFGEDVLPLPAPSSSDGDQDPADVARITELQEKIAQLEIQAEQARSPQLQIGLENVLAGLRKKLPPRSGDEVSSAIANQVCNRLDDEGDGDV